ncbi:MAG: hypothetical protein R3C28_15735 [Pirellulaceae bacterium]
MRTFHVFLHAKPAIELTAARRSQPLLELPCEVLRLTPEMVSAPLDVSFESAGERLQALPQLYFEPDGSFVWVGQTATSERWQLDGLLNDGIATLQNVELKGTCDPDAWDQILDAFQLSGDAVVLQLAKEGVFVTDPEFRRVFLTA